ncbi:hypothetical protein [Halosolutus gelatinilyticus]|uniref:hypothetical protein n=1 Tax=Halosolutus gelatinilyticus TaxID=2931975 RepID=UPI001FF42FC1|nr:hypothetical protein [Halosolutus gelatinilyticus]
MTDTIHPCPLCAYAASTRDGVYAHLLTSHRKSEISTVLLETRTSVVEPNPP